MYSAGGGDARSASASCAREPVSSSFPGDHASSAFGRHLFGVDSRYERADREYKYPSYGKKEWSPSLDRPSTHRSSSALCSSPSFTSRRRPLGRHGAGLDSGRYGNSFACSYDSSIPRFKTSPTDSGKAERVECSPSPRYGRYNTNTAWSVDGATGRFTASAAENGKVDKWDEHGPGYGKYGMWLAAPSFENGNGKMDRNGLGPSPRYRRSPNTERSTRDLGDGLHYRECSLSPTDRRSGSSPRLNMAAHPYGRDGLGMRYRERSKHSTSHRFDRESDYRDRVWNKSDYHRRTYSLPKLESTREWSLLEARIDRYRSSRDNGSSDVRSSGGHCLREDWVNWKRILHSIESPNHLSSSSLFRERSSGGLASELPVTSSPPESPTVKSCFSPDSTWDNVGQGSPKKRPRLTWGQGLAKYEKAKVEEGPMTAHRSDGGDTLVDGQFGGSQVKGSPGYSGCATPNCKLLENFADSVQTHVGPGSIKGFSMVVKETAGEKSLPELDELSTKFNTTSNLVQEAKFDYTSETPMILQEVQAFLLKYNNDSCCVSKTLLMQQVEKLEYEIDLVEKEILQLGDESNIQLPSKSAEVQSSEEQVAIGLTKEMDCSLKVVCAPEAREEGICSVVPINVRLQNPTYEVTDDGIPLGNEKSEDTRENEDCNEKLFFQSDAFPTKTEQGNFTVGSRQGPRFSIVSSNQEIARQSCGALSHLLLDCNTSTACERLLCSPQEPVVWAYKVEGNEAKRRCLAMKVAEEKRFSKFKERVLAIKYRALRDCWKQEQAVLNKQDSTQDEQVAKKQEASLMLYQFGFSTPYGIHQRVQSGKNSLFCEPDRVYLKMPLMLLDERERLAHRFVSKNALVEDPVAAETERKALNPWLEDERRMFLDKFSLFGKNFRKIASFLEHKTVADCIQFYYQNQKSEEFEIIHRKHKLRKRRDGMRSGAAYLATTTPVHNKHWKASVTAEGLSLVAAAAAVVSAEKESPRMVRSTSKANEGTSSCWISSPSYKSQSAGRAGKVSREHQPLGLRGARISHSRSLKGPTEEGDLLWTDGERERFLSAVALFGKDFKSISLHVGTKNQGQCKAFFSKTRKRLGLDQLLECHKSSFQGSSKIQSRQGTVEDLNNSRQGQVVTGDSDGTVYEPFCQQAVEMATSIEMPEEKFLQVSVSVNAENVPDPSCDVMNLVTTLQDQTYQDVEVKAQNGVCSSMPGFVSDAVRVTYHVSTGSSPNNHVTVDQESPDYSRLQQRIAEPVSEIKSIAFANGTCLPAPEATASAVVLPCPVSVASETQSALGKDKATKLMDTKTRREPTSWTPEEKEKFIDIIKVYGKNWDRLRESLPAKSLTQIKTYFQNSKAKLSLITEGTVSGNGRGGSLKKRKAEDIDASNVNMQIASQKLHVERDGGTMKFNSTALVSSEGVESKAMGIDTLAYTSHIGGNSRQVLIDTFSTQRMYPSMGLLQNSSTPGIVPVFTSSLSSPVSGVPTQQSYSGPFSKMQQAVNQQQSQQSLGPHVTALPLQLETSGSAVHQFHQLQPVASVHQDLMSPVAQHLIKQTAHLQETSAQNLLQQHHVVQHLQQQVAEAVLQQLQLQRQQHQQSQLQALNQSIHQPLSLSLQNQQLPPSQNKNVALGQQQTDLFQSQLDQIQSNLQVFLQQFHMPLQQEQLQQLQKDAQFQSPVQRQQAVDLLQLPKQNFGTSQLPQEINNNQEQQQRQLAALRIIQLAAMGSDLLKLWNSDSQALPAFQQVISNEFQQPLVVCQGSESLLKSQAISELQERSSDVKLFGQLLLPQTAPCSQQTTGNASSNIGISVSSGSSSKSTEGPLTVNSSGILGPDSTKAGILQDSFAEKSVGNVREPHEAVTHFPKCTNEQVMELQNGGVNILAAKSDMGQLQDGKTELSVNFCLDRGVLDKANSPSNSSGEVRQSDKGFITSNQAGVGQGLVSGMSMSNPLSTVLSGGQVAASQGLPPVLDALVALTEWRVKNSTIVEGRLTAEFLSNSWEAICRDPGLLTEVGKASVSLPQMYPGGSDTLQQLGHSPLYSQVPLGVGGISHLCSSDSRNTSNLVASLVHSVHNESRSDEQGMPEAGILDGCASETG